MNHDDERANRIFSVFLLIGIAIAIASFSIGCLMTFLLFQK